MIVLPVLVQAIHSNFLVQPGAFKGNRFLHPQTAKNDAHTTAAEKAIRARLCSIQTPFPCFITIPIMRVSKFRGKSQSLPLI